MFSFRRHTSLTQILRLDDFEDSSPLRRGRPAAHAIFGAAQTINSANYWILKALDEVRRLGDSECLTIFIGKSLRSISTRLLSCM